MLDLSSFGVTRESTRLSNGIPVVLFKKPNAPVVMLAAFLAGSRFDPIGKEGLAHFTEHMLMSGTPSFPSKEKIAEFVASMGGYKNAFTGFDVLGVDLAAAETSDVESFAKLLSEILTQSIFDEKILEKERGAILSELEMYRTSPTRQLGTISHRLTYQDTAVARDIIGTVESINSITKDDIVSFYKKQINTSNMSIITSGDIEFKTLIEVLEKYLGNVSSGERNDVLTDLPIIRVTHSVFENFKGDNVNLDISFRTGNLKHKDAAALSVLGSILGGSGGVGLLMKKLRFEKGLVYHASAGVGLSVDRGAFGLDTSFAKKNLKEVIDNICLEIKRLKTDGPSANDLTLTKNKVTKSKKRTMQTSGDWVDYHDNRILMYPDENWTIVDSLQAFNSVTLEQLKDVAQKYLTKDNWYLAATGNVKEEDLKDIDLDI